MLFLLPVVFFAIKSTSFLPAIVICTVLTFSNVAGEVAASEIKTIAIGALIDVNTRSGKEIKTAIEVAAHNFNYSSVNHKLSLLFRNPGENPIHAANAAEELIQEKHVHALVGMKTWEQTALVAEVGKEPQVPIISFAETAAPEPWTREQWPFLFPLASNLSEQFTCIASIIGSFNWRKVIVIYEVDSYGGDSGIYAAFSEALLTIDVEIEHRVVLPMFSSLSDPKSYVAKAMVTLLSKQSRVFVVLQSSLPLAVLLFEKAKRLRLSGRDSAWIIADSISSHMESLDPSVISNMEGFVGVRTYFSEDSKSFVHFRKQFKQFFRSEYPEEDRSEIGIHTLRAYDSINAITHAVSNMTADNISRAELGRFISEIKFSGLSGNISFSRSELLTRLSIFRIINVVGKSYQELDFWSSKVGFSTSPNGEKSSAKDQGTPSIRFWPGNLQRNPKGWSMPTDAKPLKIGVPARTSFEKFVKVKWNESTNHSSYSGYCIDIFFQVLRILERKYPFPHEFYPINGTYDELVQSVANKTVDAIVGDVTILSERSKLVQFTQPFAESGVMMVVTLMSENKAWIFLKPFNKEMWAVTGVILVYTVFVIWLLEHQLNSEFEGSWWNQMGTALWFIFSSLLFVHRDRIRRSYTRSGNITAAFLELPYGKAFLNKHCKGYTVANKNTARLGRDRFGGLGFVFQKGSPWASDFSQAILILSETGKLKELEIQYFSPSPSCSQTSDDNGSLSWRSFWGLYLFSAGTSTICYLLSSIHQIYLKWRREKNKLPFYSHSEMELGRGFNRITGRERKHFSEI